MTANQQDELDFSNNPEASRYEAHLAGVLAGYCEYERAGTVLTMPHTLVQTEFEGRGIGRRLVAFALDDARKQNLTIVPACWFVEEFIERNPEYADLVAA
jgi:predicted GNAT family acetyltransferase